jgi:hypothetical protein
MDVNAINKSDTVNLKSGLDRTGLGDLKNKIDASDVGAVQPGGVQPADSKTPGFLSRAWGQIKAYGSKAYDAISNIPDRVRAQFSPSQPVQPAPPQTQAQTVPATPAAPAVQRAGPAIGQELAGQQRATEGPHMTVQAGPDDKHEFTKGLGFQTGGVVENVAHHDGKADLQYKVGGHEELISVPEDSGAGTGPSRRSAISEALDELKPGDRFDMKISRDANNHEVTEITDKTENFQVKVHDTGQIEKGQSFEIGRTKDINR